MVERILVSTRKGLFTLSRNGGWDISGVDFLGENVSLAMHDPRTGNDFAALDHGHFGVKLQRRKPGGAWEELKAPAFPPKPEGFVDPDGWGRDIPWNVMRVWALQPGGADQPGLIWCGTIPGGVFRSDDDGENWTFLDSVWSHPKRKKWLGGGADWPGVHSFCIDPRDSATLRFGVSCGGVWRSTDKGDTWDVTATGLRAEWVPPEQVYDPEIQDVHYLAQSRGEPDKMWVQHHNGIFRTTDSGISWSEITGVDPSTFGFAVAVHPQQGDTAWFVPGIKDEQRIPADGAFVVTRTRDGGKSFEKLTNGLPQRHAYDIVLRHGLALDETGNTLVMGSSTGGLWVSENQGDNWKAVSNTLPPVYAVCFA